MGSTKAKWRNNILTFFDRNTHETVKPLAPIYFYDDFEGTVIRTTAAGVAGWTVKDTSAAGDALPAIVANQHGGIARLKLAAASDEKEESGLYLGDALNFNIDKGPIIEIRAAVAVAPDLLAEIYFGFANAYAEGPLTTDGPTIHAMFHFDGSLACVVSTDDTVTDNDAVSTGVTVVATEFHIFRIDMTDPTDVKFYIDGAGVATGTKFSMAESSNVVVQPFLMCHKESGLGAGSLDVDYVKIWSPR